MDENRTDVPEPVLPPAVSAVVVEEAPAPISAPPVQLLGPVDEDARRAKLVAGVALALLPLVPLSRVAESAALASASSAPLFAGAAAAYLGWQARQAAAAVASVSVSSPASSLPPVAPANPEDARHAVLGGALAVALWLVLTVSSVTVQEWAQARAHREAEAAAKVALENEANEAKKRAKDEEVVADPSCPADGATRFYTSPGARTRCTGEAKPPVNMSWREAQGFLKAHGLHVRRGLTPEKLWGEGDKLRVLLTFDVTQSVEPPVGLDLHCQDACPEGGWRALATAYAGVDAAALTEVVPGAAKATMVKTARGALPMRVDANEREVFFGVNAAP